MSRYISREELGLIAKKYTDRYFRMVGKDSDGFLPPVDPGLLAKHILDLNLQFLPLSLDGSVLGLSVFDHIDLEVSFADGTTETVTLGEKDIVVDTELLGEHYTGRRNFTIAHENAHHILNREFPSRKEIYRHRCVHVLYRRKTRYDPEEWRADALASMMLMPKALVMDCMRRYDLGYIKILNKMFYPEEYEKFELIASFLGVSRQALCIRMKQLNLVRKEYLANPNDLVNVYMDE